MLRFTVLNRYDGQRWIAANDVEPGSHEDRFQLFSADYLTTDEATDATPIRIGLTGAWSSQWVPLAGRLVGLNVDFPGSVPVSDLRVNPVTSTAVATRTLGRRDEYEFFFEPLDTTLPDDAKPSRLVDEPTYDAADFADTWARAARRRASSRMEAVLDAAALMKKRGRYSDGAFGWEVRSPAGRAATGSTTSSTARTWSATTSSTPRRWRSSPPGSACPRAWSSARGCRPTASSRATT